MTPEPDFSVYHHGSISTLVPRSDAGREWIEENLPDDAQWFGGGVAIERRYLSPILIGIEVEAGLVIG
jgi:hypothetical protein